MTWSGAGDCRTGRRVTIALLYLLGRMPEEIEEAYEIHLLECRSCLVRAQAVEQALRFRGCFQGEIRDMRDLRTKLFPLVVLFLGDLPVAASESTRPK